MNENYQTEKYCRTITLGDLISELTYLVDTLEGGEDTPVFVGADYGDIMYTQQALNIERITEEQVVDGQGYSRSGLAVAKGEEDNLDDYTVVVIHGT